MSGADSNSPDKRDVLAAEYVLGLLDPDAMGRVAAASAGDPDLAARITAWSEHLEPLTALVPPVAPGSGLWDRIARDIAARRPLPAQPPRRLPMPEPAAVPPPAPAALWRVAAMAGFATAACLAVALALSGHHLDVRMTWDAAPPAPPRAPPVLIGSAPPAPPPAPPPARPVPPPAPAKLVAPPPAASPVAVALLDAPGRDQPAMKAIVARSGSIRLTALQTVAVPPGRELAFWVWPHNAAAPIRVGRIAADGGVLPFPYAPEDGTPVMITLEPANLPATEDRGPTLLQGALALVD